MKLTEQYNCICQLTLSGIHGGQRVLAAVKLDSGRTAVEAMIGVFADGRSIRSDNVAVSATLYDALHPMTETIKIEMLSTIGKMNGILETIPKEYSASLGLPPRP